MTPKQKYKVGFGNCVTVMKESPCSEDSRCFIPNPSETQNIPSACSRQLLKPQASFTAIRQRERERDGERKKEGIPTGFQCFVLQPKVSGKALSGGTGRNDIITGLVPQS